MVPEQLEFNSNTSFNKEGVSLPPLNVNLGDEQVVDVPGNAPRRLACDLTRLDISCTFEEELVTSDGSVALFATSRPNSSSEHLLPRDDVRLPRFNRALRCCRCRRSGRLRLVDRGEQHWALVHSPAREVDPVVLCESSKSFNSLVCAFGVP